MKDPDAALVLHLDHSRSMPEPAPPDSIILRPGVPVQIVSSTWRVTGPDSALLLDAPSIGSETTTQIRLTGGTLGCVYDVFNRVQLNAEPPRLLANHVAVLIVQS